MNNLELASERILENAVEFIAEKSKVVQGLEDVDFMVIAVRAKNGEFATIGHSFKKGKEL